MELQKWIIGYTVFLAQIAVLQNIINSKMLLLS